MPEGGDSTTETDATRRRRRLRDVEMQILFRAVLANSADDEKIKLLLESASFDLQAPHVDCTTRRRPHVSPASPILRGQYDSLKEFFDGAIAPGLKIFAPRVLAQIVRDFEFDDAASRPTPATVRRPPRESPPRKRILAAPAPEKKRKLLQEQLPPKKAPYRSSAYAYRPAAAARCYASGTVSTGNAGLHNNTGAAAPPDAAKRRLALALSAVVNDAEPRRSSSRVASFGAALSPSPPRMRAQKSAAASFTAAAAPPSRLTGAAARRAANAAAREQQRLVISSPPPAQCVLFLCSYVHHKKICRRQRRSVVAETPELDVSHH